MHLSLLHANPARDQRTRMKTPKPHPHLIAVDWGTSALRAALIVQGRIVAQRHSDQGILRIKQGGFATALADFCGDWMTTPNALTLICGMAGSAQGWQLAPYMACPSPLQNLTQHLVWLQPHKVALVPGLSCELPHAPDVMRGEETQVLGALELLGHASATVVLPGTHSKWVQVQDGHVMRFNTFMTGEFFSVLRQHSILARTLPQENLSPFDADPLTEEAFDAGADGSKRAKYFAHGVFCPHPVLDDATNPRARTGLSFRLVDRRGVACPIRQPGWSFGRDCQRRAATTLSAGFDVAWGYMSIDGRRSDVARLAKPGSKRDGTRQASMTP